MSNTGLVNSIVASQQGGPQFKSSSSHSPKTCMFRLNGDTKFPLGLSVRVNDVHSQSWML